MRGTGRCGARAWAQAGRLKPGEEREGPGPGSVEVALEAHLRVPWVSLRGRGRVCARLAVGGVAAS